MTDPDSPLIALVVVLLVALVVLLVAALRGVAMPSEVSSLVAALSGGIVARALARSRTPRPR